MVAIGLSALQRLLGRDRGAILIMVPSFLILTLMLVATRDQWAASIAVGHVPLTLTLVTFFTGIAIGVPIAFSLMIGTSVYIFSSGAVPMIALSQNMVDGTGSFVLLALPFFILAGIIMERGQISSRLVQFVQSLVGHYRSGLLQAGVVSMYLMSGLSGSKAADIAAVGSILREKLRSEGYSLEQGAAVLAASAAMGETIPPSIAMLVVGSITTLSVGALFVAGIIPAAVIAVCLMVLIYVQALWIGAPRSPRVSLGAMLRTAVAAVPPMMMPLILFGGIIFGVATPTEVSAFAVVYGIMLAGLAYREFTFKSFLASTYECTLLSGMILFIVAAASSFSWVLTIAGLPQSLADLLGSTHGNQALFLFRVMHSFNCHWVDPGRSARFAYPFTVAGADFRGGGTQSVALRHRFGHCDWNRRFHSADRSRLLYRLRGLQCADRSDCAANDSFCRAFGDRTFYRRLRSLVHTVSTEIGWS